jgi:Na+/H+ antiporter NhaD/arsenite permease-like protein
MVSASAIVTLVLFIVSIIFVIIPVYIPVPLSANRRISIPITLTTAPIFVILLLWVSECIGSKVIVDGIVGTEGVKPYNILILFFSLAYMSITLDVSGILRAAAFWVSNRSGANGRRLYLYLYLMLTLVSIVIGNDPVILSGTVFLVYYTEAMKLDPNPWLISEFAAANTASMVLFVGNPTNVVVCEGFSINNLIFSAYTIFPFIACSVFCYAVLRFQFRGPKHIPKELQLTGYLNPREALQDPVGAIVGSVLLGLCLALTFVVGFFNIDVWLIALPFALAKFFFDIAWDYYRFRRRPAPSIDSKSETESQHSEMLHFEPQPKVVANLPRSTTIAVPAARVEERHPDPVKLRAQTEPPPRRSAFSLPPSYLPSKPIRSSTPEAMDSSGVESSNRDLTSSPELQDSSSSAPPTRNIHRPSTDDKSTAVPAEPPLFPGLRHKWTPYRRWLKDRFPTLMKATPRLPFALVPFAFSQFILIEALGHQGWIAIFAEWLVAASGRRLFPTVWLVGVLGVVLCNIAGTNIGATILLTKIMHDAAMPPHSARGGAIALAVASNIGAVSFTFSASLAGLLWKSILNSKGIQISQARFAYWNTLPIIIMTSVGLAVVSIEMAILFR